MQSKPFHEKINNLHIKAKIFEADMRLCFHYTPSTQWCLYDTRRGGSNEYPQSMFWSKNKKNRYTPAYPRFAI